jgi:hypothetical protein
MFHLAAASVGSVRPLAIGDRLDTDLKGARAAGMPGLLVLTGVSSARDAVLAQADQRPSYIGEDLRCLNEVHPRPVRVGTVWTVGQASATVDGRTLSVDGEGIDAVRAACAAAWAAADVGIMVDAGSVPDFRVGL